MTLRAASLWQDRTGTLRGVLGDMIVVVRRIPDERRSGHSAPTHELLLRARGPLRKSVRAAYDAFGVSTYPDPDPDGALER